ncbi:hypothetical protein FOG51_01181 [Hanseniaspora uvarum]|nr:hypothetical protein FOG51_01181 [Hanseniaspora uvarum]KAF0277313.1 hypothetical protein FOG50_01831 [Hanseniaspora uvarum]
MSEDKYKILFIHPDLGIGGAERLVIDYALGLQECGNDVKIATSHYNKDHSFEETKNLNIEVYGDFLPRSFKNKFMIIFSILRQLWLVFYLFFKKDLNNYDFIIVDQLSIGLPLLQYFSSAKIIFYCHFPDLLLSNKQSSIIKQLYRLPLDFLEQVTTGSSDKLLVNSHFTKDIFYKTFKMLRDRNDVEVSYPCIDTELPKIDSETHDIFNKHLGSADSDCEYLISVNRFEKKKNLELAIKSYHLTLDYMSKARKDKLKLFVCGGYDERVLENKEYLNELKKLCDDLNLNYTVIDGKNMELNNITPKVVKEKLHVIFIKSIPTQLKNLLISKSSLLLYTPSNEHFGIVPLESMLLGTPVLAPNNGGPLETVSQNETGWLIEPKYTEWSRSILNCLLTIDQKEIGPKCKTYAAENFSRKKIVNRNLHDRILKKLNKEKKVKSPIFEVFVNSILNLIFFFTTQFLFVSVGGLEKTYLYGAMVAFNLLILKSFRFGIYWGILGAMFMQNQ